jgi:hypothetical protein
MVKSDHKTSHPAVSANQQLAIDVLLAGGTDSEAAQAASVTRETVCRWRHSDADFIAAYNRERRAASEATADSLRQASLKAIKTLSDILSDEDCSLRIKAASILLGQYDEAQAPGDTDPEAIRAGWDEARREREHRAFFGQP